MSRALYTSAVEPVASSESRVDAAEHDQHYHAEPATYPAGDSHP